MKVLIIDNYDSFTFNLYQSIGELSEEEGMPFVIDVIRNDQISLKEIINRRYDRIILSPGPGDPKDRVYFGVCADILMQIKNIPILGVCLGMQGIAHYFGGKVVKATQPMHGKTSIINHDEKSLFKNIPQGIEVMRYHSLIIDPKNLPECLEISAVVSFGLLRSERKFFRSAIEMRKTLESPSMGQDANFKNFVPPRNHNIEIMGLRHKTLPIEGVQFHPESFATEAGKTILSNFLLL